MSEKKSDLFDDVPGPSPWYLTPEALACEGFRWQSAGNGSITAGKTLLVGDDGPVAILNFENYVKVLGPSKLLIWHQGTAGDTLTPPIHFLIVEPKLLKALNDLDALYQSMNSSRKPILLGGSPSAEFNLATTVAGDDLIAEFPPQLCAIDELLLFCRSSAIGIADGWSKANLALLVANPRASTFRLCPQDWFNEGSFDYGYQWATRVVRDPVTKQVHGEGIRIGSFILDDSLRTLRNNSSMQ